MLKKLCIIVSAILLVIVVILVILYFTVFKPKEPKIISQPATLEKIRWSFFPVQLLNVTLGISVTIDNPNYGSFKYQESTAYVSYRGNVVGEAPIEADEIPARGKHNISTLVTIFADKLLNNDDFQHDFLSGILNFTSSATLQGKVTVFKLFKAKATGFSTCDISIFFVEKQTDSICQSKVSL